MTTIKPRTSRSRLFIGIMPTGLSYADRTIEENGDYKKLAFLDFATLMLMIAGEPDYRSEEIYRGDSPIIRKIKKHAHAIQRRRDEPFEVSASGQTITLGYAGWPIPETTCQEFRGWLAQVGAANSKTPEQVYALWHKYAVSVSGEGGQSAIFSEFLGWYRKELPNVPVGRITTMLRFIRRIVAYFRCPACGYWGFDGEQCWDCGYRP